MVFRNTGHIRTQKELREEVGRGEGVCVCVLATTDDLIYLMRVQLVQRFRGKSEISLLQCIRVHSIQDTVSTFC